MPEPDGIQVFNYVFGREAPSEVFSYTPEPPRCTCGAVLSYTTKLSDAVVPNLTLTITHPEPVCDDFGPMLRRCYFPTE